MTPFDAPWKQVFLKTLWEKEKLQYLLFQQCFLLVGITFCHFYLISNCRLQTLSVWKSLNLSYRNWLNLTRSRFCRGPVWLSGKVFFYPFEKVFAIFINLKIVVCKLFSFEESNCHLRQD